MPALPESPSNKRLEQLLLVLTAGLFIWFFASSLGIAWHKSLQHDDAMFATIPKNFLAGYGWATSYGEKIPFNPDISTGPTLLLPAALMIALFGNEAWVPAVTGCLMNIALCILIAWQLWKTMGRRSAACFSLLLAISLFAVNDFKTFTGYYTCSLLFLFSLLFVLNRQYKAGLRFFSYGALAAVGLYGKPLVFLSFLLAFPLILIIEFYFLKKIYALILISACGFLLVFLPWQLYKLSVLSEYSDDYRRAHREYHQDFFEHHGTGIGQLKSADEKIRYIKSNAKKNYRILSGFLKKENGFPVLLFAFTIISALAISAKKIAVTYRSDNPDFPGESIFAGILAFVIAGNSFWYIVLSFAMTPGHAFFLTFFSFFLLFFLLATQSRSNMAGYLLCTITALVFQARLPALVEAYSFRATDVLINNQQMKVTREFLLSFKPRYPLASCGYGAASYRMEYLLPGSHNFLDCFNVLEDSLASDAQARFYWKTSPDFTLVVEALSFLAVMKSQSYVLQPMADACLRHVVFREGGFVVCEVPFDEVRGQLDPVETANQLRNYQQWYRTRIKGS